MHRMHGSAKTVGTLVGLATPLLLAGCAPQSVTEQGAAIGRLYNLFLVIAAVVWATVTGVMVWSLVRYRRKDGDDQLPKQIHGNKYWEAAWTLIPLVIIAGLIVATVKTQNTVLHQQPDPDLTTRQRSTRRWATTAMRTVAPRGGESERFRTRSPVRCGGLTSVPWCTENRPIMVSRRSRWEQAPATSTFVPGAT